MFYNARWYDPALGRMAQADSIVPGGVQGLDRYAYVRNSPLNYVDPSGHYESCPDAPRGKCPKKPDVSLSPQAQDLIDFSKSVGLSPEEVIGIGLGHETFSETPEERAIHMDAYRNGFLRYADTHCNGRRTHNCMLNYFAGSYQSVYGQFLTKKYWGHRTAYLFDQHYYIDDDGRLQSNLSKNHQTATDAGVDFATNFMSTISGYSYDPNDPDVVINTGDVAAGDLDVALSKAGTTLNAAGFVVAVSGYCTNGVKIYSLVYTQGAERFLDTNHISSTYECP